MMALMYAMWLPLPWGLNQILEAESLRVGAIFGTVYLSMMLIK